MVDDSYWTNWHDEHGQSPWWQYDAHSKYCMSAICMHNMSTVCMHNMMHILWWWQCTLDVYPMVMVPYVADLDDVFDTLMTKLYDIVAAVRIFSELLYQHINPRWSSPKLQKSLSNLWLKFVWCKFKIQGIKYGRMQYEQSVNTYSNEACLLQDLCSNDDQSLL